MLRQGRVNPWPAFSDMMFMLALTTLVISAGVVTITQRQRAELEVASKDNKALEQQLKALGIDPRANQECGLATPVVRAMESCLQNKGVPVERRGCSLSVEGSIRFEFNRTTLSDEAAQVAERVADCIIVGAQKVAESTQINGVGLDAISIEGHADQCGYRDWARVREGGMGQPAARAKAVYDIVFQKVTAPPSGFDDVQKSAILARVATRSFGPYRPLVNTACDCNRPASCAADRRVEIVVQGQVGGGEFNWHPVSRIRFATPPDSPTVSNGETP